jgi:hypothetical protein
MNKLIFIENFFPNNYFHQITSSHSLYNLRESTKESISLRKGVYLSNVHNGFYNLLRCSTNLAGPTENFNDYDREIIKLVTSEATKHFSLFAEFNHVLAQTYHNCRINSKNKKAKIKEHSDKTKDMNENGLMAFCTFYDNDNASQFTKIRFRHKVTNEICNFILTNKSLLIIDLDTNATYTHEIIPPPGEVEDLPTRLGYVIRSSKTIGHYTPEGTYCNDVLMHRPSPEEIEMLRELYYKENVEAKKIVYPQIYFSMNDGDYMQPKE